MPFFLHTLELLGIYTYIYNHPEVDRIWYGFNPATEKKNMYIEYLCPIDQNSVDRIFRWCSCIDQKMVDRISILPAFKYNHGRLNRILQNSIWELNWKKHIEYLGFEGGFFHLEYSLCPHVLSNFLLSTDIFSFIPGKRPATASKRK